MLPLLGAHSSWLSNSVGISQDSESRQEFKATVLPWKWPSAVRTCIKFGSGEASSSTQWDLFFFWPGEQMWNSKSSMCSKSGDLHSASYAEKPCETFIYSNYCHLPSYFMCSVNLRALYPWLYEYIVSFSVSGRVCLVVCQLTSTLCVDTVSYGFLIAENLHKQLGSCSYFTSVSQPFSQSVSHSFSQSFWQARLISEPSS